MTTLEAALSQVTAEQLGTEATATDVETYPNALRAVWPADEHGNACHLSTDERTELEAKTFDAWCRLGG